MLNALIIREIIIKNCNKLSMRIPMHTHNCQIECLFHDEKSLLLINKMIIKAKQLDQLLKTLIIECHL